MLKLYFGNISDLSASVDVVVNSTNSAHFIRTGADLYLRNKAGYRYQLEVDKQEKFHVGVPVFTGAGDLGSKQILQIVLPNFDKNNAEASIQQLEDCYAACVQAIRKAGYRSAAFTLSGSGYRGYDKHVVFERAMNVFLKHFMDTDFTIAFVIMDTDVWKRATRLFHIEQLITPDDVKEYNRKITEQADFKDVPEIYRTNPENLGPSRKDFFEVLEEIGINHGLRTNADRYKAAGIDRRHFDKIKKGENKLSKDVVFRYCIGMKLTLPEATILVTAAGFTFGGNDKDEIIRTCLRERIYKMDTVNQKLQEAGLDPLFKSRNRKEAA